MDNPIGTYSLEPVWVTRGCLANRFECHRCGLVVQATQDDPDSNDKARAATRHVCDPSKKDGRPAFDPTKPYTWLEKTKEILAKHAQKTEATS